MRGIWTLAWLLTTYSLSRGAPSASWVSLRIKETNITLPAYSSTPFHICQVVVSTGEKLSHYTTWISDIKEWLRGMIHWRSNCEEYYIGKKIEKRRKKVLTKGKRCDSISKLSARAAEKSKNSEKFEGNWKKFLTSFERYAKIIKLLERVTRERSENEVWKNLKKVLDKWKWMC